MRAALALLMLAAAGAVQAAPCGELRSLAVREGASQAFSLNPPSAEPAITLVLLAGGGGHLKLDEKGCATALKGNALVRAQPLLQAQGFGTALVDAPSDQQAGDDGLAGFRTDPRHAADLGRLIETLRAVQGGGQVWLVGTSRGTISTVNAASRLQGAAAPDGVVLSSILTVGTPMGRKTWTSQSVFDLDLAAIRQPVLLLGHADDDCPRSPPRQMAEVAKRLRNARLEQQLIKGGPGGSGDACEGRSPHGFVGQDAELVEAIRRFVRPSP
ncbi:hypothetical protein J7U46_15800 [Pelomonas sp. V22]|uniref:alpha/beta hydrolase n=1 Tax=Pelomonas sp. V22 TaxID=2822139 RepID=UPI0024A9D0D7|nr:hypothetical protein [Pelomonas sp. V22]MDI4634524.1 hypothetical protein [Pelomonas sp. V22]